MEIEPDVEVVFEFTGARKTPCFDGYRPNHLVKDDYLTSGVHHYYDVDKVPPNGNAKGTITFLTPEAYPSCLWVSRRINIQESSKIVGYATLLKYLTLSWTEEQYKTTAWFAKSIFDHAETANIKYLYDLRGDLYGRLIKTIS